VNNPIVFLYLLEHGAGDTITYFARVKSYSNNQVLMHYISLFNSELSYCSEKNYEVLLIGVEGA
jgi:hypothetical protein